MEFKQASINGTIKPSKYLTRQSQLFVGLASTTTNFSQTATINITVTAPIYKTSSPLIYDNGTLLNNTAVFNGFTATVKLKTLGTGTHNITATWPGQGRYAPINKITSSATLSISPGFSVDGPFVIDARNDGYLGISDPYINGEPVEITAYFTNASKPVAGTDVKFYKDGVYLNSANLVAAGGGIEINTYTSKTIQFAEIRTSKDVYAVALNDLEDIYVGSAFKFYDSTTTVHTVAALYPSGHPDAVYPKPNTIQLDTWSIGEFQALRDAGYLNTGTVLKFNLSTVSLNAYTATITTEFTTGVYKLHAVWDERTLSDDQFYLRRQSNTATLTVLDGYTLDRPVNLTVSQPRIIGENITLTASINTATELANTFTFYVDDIAVGSVESNYNNSATLTTTIATTGTHNIYAMWTGGGDNFIGGGPYPSRPRRFLATTSTTTTIVVDAGRKVTMTLSASTSTSSTASETTLVTVLNTSTVIGGTEGGALTLLVDESSLKYVNDKIAFTVVPDGVVKDTNNVHDNLTFSTASSNISLLQTVSTSTYSSNGDRLKMTFNGSAFNIGPDYDYFEFKILGIRDYGNQGRSAIRVYVVDSRLSDPNYLSEIRYNYALTSSTYTVYNGVVGESIYYAGNWPSGQAVPSSYLRDACRIYVAGTEYSDDRTYDYYITRSPYDEPQVINTGTSNQCYIYPNILELVPTVKDFAGNPGYWQFPVSDSIKSDWRTLNNSKLTLRVPRVDNQVSAFNTATQYRINKSLGIEIWNTSTQAQLDQNYGAWTGNVWVGPPYSNAPAYPYVEINTLFQTTASISTGTIKPVIFDRWATLSTGTVAFEILERKTSTSTFVPTTPRLVSPSTGRVLSTTTFFQNISTVTLASSVLNTAGTYTITAVWEGKATSPKFAGTNSNSITITKT